LGKLVGEVANLILMSSRYKLDLCTMLESTYHLIGFYVSYMVPLRCMSHCPGNVIQDMKSGIWLGADFR